MKNPRDYIPHVFSHSEIMRIFKVIDELDFKHHKELKLFYQTFFRLLYTTGLRLGEALNLKVDDVDLDNNIITIHSGKGNVSRLVPFKDSLAAWLKEYKAKNSKKLMPIFLNLATAEENQIVLLVIFLEKQY